MGSLLAIANKTFLEVVRQPIYSVLMWSAAAIIVLNMGLSGFSLERGGDTKMLVNIALSTLLLYGVIASVFTATSVVTREIESNTVLTVVSKPVSRPVFFLGKYLGVASAMAVSFVLLALVLIMVARHGVLEYTSDPYDLPVLVFGLGAILVSLVAATFGNFVYNWNFLTALTAWVVPLGLAGTAATLFFSKDFAPQSPWTGFASEQAMLDPTFVYAGLLLVFLAILLQTAIAVALSTRFSAEVTLALCLGIFLLGLLSDSLFDPQAEQATLLNQILYRIVPNFQFFWIGDALTQEVSVGFGDVVKQVGNVAAYAALQITAVLALGIAAFQTREVG